jgi:hypothetical protein
MYSVAMLVASTITCGAATILESMMNRIPIETNWHAAKRRIGRLWRPNRPPGVPASDSPAAYVTAATLAEKIAVQETFAPASLLNRAAAVVSPPTMPGKKKEEVKQQVEALSAWEDEGGAAAVSTPKKTTGKSGT